MNKNNNLMICTILVLNVLIVSGFSSPTSKTETNFEDEFTSDPYTAAMNDPATARQPQYWSRLSDADRDRLYQDNFNEFRDKFDEEWQSQGVNLNSPAGSSYNPTTREMTFPSGTKVPLDTMQGRKIEYINGNVMVDDNIYTGADEVSSDGETVTANQATHIQTPKTGIWDGNNVRLNNDGTISADSARVISNTNTQIIEPRNYAGNSTHFSMTEAERIIVGTCLNYNEVTETAFEVSYAYSTTTGTGPLNITDCRDEPIYFTPTGNGTMTIQIDQNRYEIANGTMMYKSENITADNKAEVMMTNGSIHCAFMSPPARYIHSGESPMDDFMLNIKHSDYKLCFRRTNTDAIQPMPPNQGLVDFIENKSFLIGQIQYLRHPLTYHSVMSFDFINAYEGLASDAAAYISLDGPFISRLHATGRSVSNPAEYISITEEEDSWVSLSHERIYTINIAKEYNEAEINDNIFRRGNHRIYPYDISHISMLMAELAIIQNDLGVAG